MTSTVKVEPALKPALPVLRTPGLRPGATKPPLSTLTGPVVPVPPSVPVLPTVKLLVAVEPVTNSVPAETSVVPEYPLVPLSVSIEPALICVVWKPFVADGM